MTQTQQAKHTPGPLELLVNHVTSFCLSDNHRCWPTTRAWKVKEAKEVLLSDAREARAECDRLKALNAELLAALKQLHTEADRLGNYLSDKGQGATMLGLACHKAKAAIAKCEGR